MKLLQKRAKTRNIISLNNNGYVKTPSIKLESGTYSVSLYAKGTKVNGIGPRIKVELYNLDFRTFMPHWIVNL